VKKVLLIGDSIRLGYEEEVKKELQGEYEVWGPEENCRFAKYTLRGMWDWAEPMKGSRIVHWNNGLWDVCKLFGDGHFSDKDEYVECMCRVAKILLSRHDKVIFATTTPVTEQNPHNRNEDIIAFNEALVPRLKELGVIINDLHALVYSNIDAYIRKDDNIHLTEEGIKVCAEQVARVIRETAATLEP
jgi:hypothetical protein